MPRIAQVFVPKNKIRFFATAAGAKAFARRECSGINVLHDSQEGSTAFLNLHNARERHYGVAILRSDQDWMTPHLRERGLSCRVLPSPTKGEKP